MWDGLLIGLFAIATGFGLLMLGLPSEAVTGAVES